MKDYIYLGATPSEEDCAQVGTEGYAERARFECKVFINQIWRWLGKKGLNKDNVPESFGIFMKSQSHDFGTYYEVVIKFDDNDEAACDLAFDVEDNFEEDYFHIENDKVFKKELEMPLIITFDRETDGRWIADIQALPGISAYGATQAEASAAVQLLAKKVVLDKIDYGELINDSISFLEDPDVLDED